MRANPVVCGLFDYSSVRKFDIMSVPVLPKPDPASNRMLTFMGFLAIVGLLYFGRDILIPIALAILISFLLSPVVMWLERRGLNRMFSVLLVVLLVLSAVSGIGYLLAGQFVEFVDNLPQYRKNIVTKLHAVQPGDRSVIRRAEEAFRDISREVGQTTSTASLTTATETGTTGTTTVVENVEVTGTLPRAAEILDNLGVPGVTSLPGVDSETTDTLAVDSHPPDNSSSSSAEENDEVLPVRVVEGPSNTWQTFMDMAGPLMRILGNAGLVILIVIFFLLKREDLRDRVLRLAGQNHVRVTTQALEESTSRVSRYLLMQLIVNVTYGVPVAIGLYFIGVPNAFLWGMMCIVLRFIPYVGPWMGASMPVALSLAVFDGWTMPLITIGMFIVLELISNNLMEPILYGHSTGVSPVAIIVSAVFWTWLWGPVGLVLATPITVCLVVLGGYIPQMAFLRVLLGDEPVLDEDVRVYNRLLSGATDEAVEIAEEYLDEYGVGNLYDDVLIQSLGRAEEDRNVDMLSEERYQKFVKGMEALLESVHDHLAEKAEKEKKELAEEIGDDGNEEDLNQRRTPAGPVRRIVCVPINDRSDELAANMFRELTKSSDCEVEVLAPDKLVSEVVDKVREAEADIIILSSVPPFDVAHSRYLAKRLRAHFPDVKLYGGLWAGQCPIERADHRLRNAGVQKVFTKVSEAARHL